MSLEDDNGYPAAPADKQRAVNDMAVAIAAAEMLAERMCVEAGKLPAIPGADIRFTRGDVRPVHCEMVAAAGGKNIWIVGGGELAGQFYDHGLLDELIIQVASVTLGGGAPLLPRAITTPPLRLVSVTSYGEAFAELRYEVPRPRGEAARS